MAALCAVLVLCPSLAAAAAPARTGTVSVILENDAFYDTDRHYTSGFQVTWTAPKENTPDWIDTAADLLPLFPERGTPRVSYGVGQRIYTPSELGDPTPDPNDRPYAGWLYGALGLMTETGGHMDQAQIAVGVVGPLSLAEQVQDVTHKILGTEDPRGWDTQLDNEPALLLTYQRSWRVLSATLPRGFGFDVTPHLGGALGNVFTYANTGLTLRFGHAMTNDYGPPRMGTNLPGAGYFGPADGGLSWYLFAGIEGRAVARNIFLDGNTFEDSASVDREPFVGDLQVGLVLNLGRLSVAYTHVLRTREFETQAEPDEYGVFSLSGRF